MNQGTRGRFKVGTLLASAINLAGTALTFTAAQFNQVMAAFGSVTFDRGVKTAVVSLTGTAIHAGTGGVVAWQNPEASPILVLRVVLDLTTVAAEVCTLDIGVTPTSATTTSDTLLDGVDANAAIGVFDSMDPTLDLAANAHAQLLALGKWVTIDEKTGDATGLIANLYVQYIVV
jgi:hypothetical protein